MKANTKNDIFFYFILFKSKKKAKVKLHSNFWKELT